MHDIVAWSVIGALAGFGIVLFTWMGLDSSEPLRLRYFLVGACIVAAIGGFVGSAINSHTKTVNLRTSQQRSTLIATGLRFVDLGSVGDTGQAQIKVGSCSQVFDVSFSHNNHSVHFIQVLGSDITRQITPAQVPGTFPVVCAAR